MLQEEAQSRLSVMNFLSEAALDYPNAISFASGRPAQQFFDLDGWLAEIPRYRDHVVRQQNSNAETVGGLLAQYGRAAGIINELVAEQISADHGVPCSGEQVIVMNGCQEALALCLQALCREPGDVALARNPTYIGATGAADCAGIPLIPIEEDDGADFSAALVRTIAAELAQGRQPRALYLIPDFDNPTGVVMSESDRLATLALCERYRIAILEDNPYGMFRFEGKAPPALAALDEYGVVLHLGTYSKTICPAVRVGFAVIPDMLFGSAAASRAFRTELGERRSYVTVNTSQINQAMVAGILLREGGSLKRFIQPSCDFYHRNRDTLLGALDAHLGAVRDRVTWNRPEGGFFLSLRLPFSFGRAEMVTCASDYDVLTTPMTFFSLDGTHTESVRLSFSNVSEDEIRRGIAAFASYVRHRIGTA
jgi:(S)-3,5-dihydroxyphenylglycine transaminase